MLDLAVARLVNCAELSVARPAVKVMSLAVTPSWVVIEDRDVSITVSPAEFTIRVRLLARCAPVVMVPLLITSPIITDRVAPAPDPTFPPPNALPNADAQLVALATPTTLAILNPSAFRSMLA